MASEPRPGPGQPPHEVTTQRQQTVQVLHAHGISHRIIAKTIGIDAKTLRKHYRTELNDAHEQVEAAMGAAIVSAAQRGAWGAAKYWLTVHGDHKWRVPETHLLAGDPEAAPIQIAINDLTDADIRRELAELRARERAATDARAVAEALPKRSNGMGH